MSEDTSQVNQIFDNAKKGDVQLLDELLSRCEDTASCLNFPTYDDKGLSATPLIIAARSNHLAVVKLLLEKYHVDVEQTGMVEFPGHPIIKGATALWCAASIGNLEMVKLLVEEFKADIDHATITNSTPLRPACFDGFVEVVEYLVSKGACVNTPTNYYSNTCLLIASYNGHDKVVNFLLERGAQIELQDFMGQTALHNAAERGRLNIAKDLISHGAKFVTDKKGLTPLHVACDFNHVEMVTYFLAIPNQFSKLDEIDALELLAASFANGSDNYSLEKCYEYFTKAIQLRYDDPNNVIVKVVLPPEEDFNNQVECQTIEELTKLENREEKLNTEALIAKERIIGKYNVHTLDIIYRGAVLADKKDYAGCLKLWKRALVIRRHNQESISQDLERHGELFSEMIEEGYNPDSKEVLNILNICVEELRLDYERMKLKNHDSETARIQGNVVTTMHTALFLTSALISDPSTTSESGFQVKKLVYQMVKINPVIESKLDPKKIGYSLMHIVCDSTTEMNEYFVQDFIQCPNYTLAYVLLECGFDANARNSANNTPLHILAKTCKEEVVEDVFGEWRDVCKLLLRKGAHIDYRNCDGKIASDYNKMMDVLAPAMRDRSLKCHAASVIKLLNIPYQNKVPFSLEEFVSKH